MIKEGKIFEKKESLIKPQYSPSLLEERNNLDGKKVKKVVSHSDDMQKSFTDMELIDNDLLEKLEKFLPISKNIKVIKNSNTVPILNSENYLEQNGNINYNKLLTDEVLATDKLLVESAKKTMNIAGKILNYIKLNNI